MKQSTPDIATHPSGVRDDTQIKKLKILSPFIGQEGIVRIIVFSTLIALPLLGGENYFFNLSPLWGKALLFLTAPPILLMSILMFKDRINLSIFPSIDGMYLAFVLFVTISYFYSKSKPESLISLLSLWGSVSLALVVRIFLKDIQSIERTAKTIVFSSLPVILYELYQSIWQFRAIINSVTADQNLQSLRSHFEFHRTPFSTFMTSNTLACYLVMVIPLIIYFFIIEKEARKKNYWAGLFSLVSFALFLTGSKGGVITYFILIASGMIFLSKIQKGAVFTVTKQIVVLVFVSFVLILLFWRIEWKPSDQNSLKNEISVFSITTDKYESSALGRIHYWKTALNMWKDHWMTGSGIGTFATISPQYQGSAFYAKHVHNDYLEMLAEAGIISLGLFLGLLIIFFIQCFKIYHKIQSDIENQIGGLEKNRMLFLGGFLILGILGFLLHSGIDFNWEITATRTLFFILLMMSFSLLGLVSSVPADSKMFRCIQIKIGNPVLIGGALLLLIFQGVWIPKVTLAESYFEMATDPFKKNLSKSIDFVQSAVALFPSHYKYHLFLAETYRNLGNREKNRDDLERAFQEGEIALSLQPETSETHAEMGALYAFKGQPAYAEAEWKGAITRSREKISLYNRLGALYLGQKEFQKAKTVLEEGLSHENDYIEANHPDMLDVVDGHLLLAGLFEAMTQNSSAAREYEQVIALLKAYPNLNSIGHWNVIAPDYSSNLEAYAKMKIDNLSR